MAIGRLQQGSGCFKVSEYRQRAVRSSGSLVLAVLGGSLFVALVNPGWASGPRPLGRGWRTPGHWAGIAYFWSRRSTKRLTGVLVHASEG